MAARRWGVVRFVGALAIVGLRLSHAPPGQSPGGAWLRLVAEDGDPAHAGGNLRVPRGGHRPAEAALGGRRDDVVLERLVVEGADRREGQTLGGERVRVAVLRGEVGRR